MNLRSTGAARPRPRANAITVDVEEWFHICGVGPLSQEHWDSLPSRVVLTTRTLLEELDRAGARATFFVLGWVAERYPGLVGEIRAAGHDIGSHGHLHARVYELDARGVRRGRETERRGAARRGCRAHRGLPGTRVVDQRSVALGARVPRPRRHHARRQHGAGPHRGQRRLPARAARAAARRRVPSSRFRLWSSIVSGTPCRSDGGGACA